MLIHMIVRSILWIMFTVGKSMKIMTVGRYCSSENIQKSGIGNFDGLHRGKSNDRSRTTTITKMITMCVCFAGVFSRLTPIKS